jgi:hypothetical protein
MDHNNAWARNVDLYRSLGTHWRQVLITTWDRDEAKRWLRTERIRYDLLMDKGVSILGDRQWKLNCVREVSAMGWPIGLYLDADPAVVQQVLAMGVTTLLISFRTHRPNWIPADNPPRAWDDLVNFIDEQREAEGGVHEVEGGRRSRWPGEVEADVP